MSSVLIEHIINNGEHCFSMTAVGNQVFWGALGFRRDAIAWAAKLKKDLLVVTQNDEDYIDASTLLRITKSIQKDGDNERIREFVKFLRRYGGRTTKRAVSTLAWKEIGFKQQWCCAGCLEMLKPTMEVDHIIPLEQGGKDCMENLQVLCAECHARKTRDERLEKIGLKRKLDTSPVVKTSKYFEEYHYNGPV
jgi:hypothetical protein